MTDYKLLSDQELFSLLKQSDRKAFSEIYGRFKAPLYVHAFNKLRDKEDVSDVIQDLFSVLWIKRDEINLTGNLAGYLFAAVRNRVFKIIAHKNIESKYIASIELSINTSKTITDDLVRENEFKKIIAKEILMLPTKMREVFELSRKNYLSHKQIAEKLDISEQTVSKQVSNALKLLHSKLDYLTCLLVFLTF